MKKPQVSEEPAVWYTDTAVPHSLMPLDSIICGDALHILPNIPDCTIDLIVTSPPYADKRTNSYGGIHPNKYVRWFLPIAKELQRVLKPSGSFILNIKEGVSDGERQTYVLELVLELKKQGWFWTEEYLWHKKIVIRGNGRIDSAMGGNIAFILIKKKTLQCTKKQSGCQWVIGLKRVLRNSVKRINAGMNQKWEAALARIYLTGLVGNWLIRIMYYI